MNERDLGRALLSIARAAIAAQFGRSPGDESTHPELALPGATFVTLKEAGELRGCIGSLEPRRPLGVDVRENALAAAFRDPRFPPLEAAEFDGTSVEVSLLSASVRVDTVDEEVLVRGLRPGVDGVILEFGRNRATFLPQVWDTISDPRRFLRALKQKAGLSEDFWNPGVNISRYCVTHWTEREILVHEEGR